MLPAKLPAKLPAINGKKSIAPLVGCMLLKETSEGVIYFLHFTPEQFCHILFKLNAYIKFFIRFFNLVMLFDFLDIILTF